MVALVDYLDYRLWLGAECERRRREERGFSLRGVLKKAGIASPSFLKQVIDGKRNLTPETTERLVAGLGLSEGDAAYFRLLVEFTQASEPGVKRDRYARLLRLAERDRVRVVGEEDYRFYEQPWLPALRELLCMKEWNGKWGEVARALRAPVTAAQAKRGAALLEKLGMVRLSGGRYFLAEPCLTTGHEISSVAVRDYNRKMMELGAKAVEQLPPERRHVSGVSFAVSAATKKKIAAEIEAFEDRLMRLIAKDREQPADEVCQLMVALFPTAELPEAKRKKETER